MTGQKEKWNPNPTGFNGKSPITDAIKVLLSRDENDPLDDKPKNKTQKLALLWLKTAESGDLQALVALTDRIEGKPSQRTELTGKDGDAIEFADRTGAGNTVRSVVSALTAGRAESDCGAAKLDKPGTAGTDSPPK